MEQSNTQAKSLRLGSFPSYDSLKLDFSKLVELEEQFGTSFFMFDMNKLRHNYLKLNRAFKSRYENFVIGYSYKTNYLPMLCKELDSLGAYPEVVSRLEYDLALRIGANPKNIIFNGPVKSRDDIWLAISNQSILNLDSTYELDYVKEYAAKHPDQIVKVGIRVNFDFSNEASHSGGYQMGRFGFCIENGEFQSALVVLKQLNNVQVVGLHGHFSTNRQLGNYEKITSTLCHLAKEYKLEQLEYLDIGGGIFGEIPKTLNIKAPTWDEYAEAICQIMNHEFPDKKPTLILEPGMALVANVFKFACKVIEVKKIRDKNFVVVDGSVHNVKPTMHKMNLPMEIVRHNPRSSSKSTFDIVGYTCMEKDYLAHEVKDTIPIRGDYLIFENVGAYTIVFNPLFIQSRPAILAVEGKDVMVARHQEQFKHFFNEELYQF